MENKIKKYFEKKEEIAAAYLFGSYASRTDTQKSDMDIGILFDNKSKQSAEKLKEQYMVELGRLLRKDIDLVVMNTAGEMLLNQIYRKGKTIVIRDYKYSEAFKIKALVIYSDFKFYLEQMQLGFLKKLKDN